MNGADRVQKFKEVAEKVMIRRFEGRMERQRAAIRRPAGAEEITDRASRHRWDKESAYAPKHGQRPRM